LEEEKNKLSKLIAQSQSSNEEVNKLKENISAMSKELHENEILVSNLQRQNEEITIQMQKEKLEVMNNLMRDTNSMDIMSNNSMFGQIVDKIWSVLPITSGKLKSLSG
jgi:SMC interacting uncharacterized protein involved in chromosome segregation